MDLSKKGTLLTQKTVMSGNENQSESLLNLGLSFSDRFSLSLSVGFILKGFSPPGSPAVLGFFIIFGDRHLTAGGFSNSPRRDSLWLGGSSVSPYEPIVVALEGLDDPEWPGLS